MSHEYHDSKYIRKERFKRRWKEKKYSFPSQGNTDFKAAFLLVLSHRRLHLVMSPSLSFA